MRITKFFFQSCQITLVHYLLQLRNNVTHPTLSGMFSWKFALVSFSKEPKTFLASVLLESRQWPCYIKCIEIFSMQNITLNADRKRQKQCHYIKLK